MAVLKPPSFFSFYHKNAALVKKMDFPAETELKRKDRPETGKKIKLAILPDGAAIKFWTEEELTSI